MSSNNLVYNENGKIKRYGLFTRLFFSLKNMDFSQLYRTQPIIGIEGNF